MIGRRHILWQRWRHYVAFTVVWFLYAVTFALIGQWMGYNRAERLWRSAYDKRTNELAEERAYSQQLSIDSSRSCQTELEEQAHYLLSEVYCICRNIP